MRIEDPKLRKYSERRGFNQSRTFKPWVYWVILTILFLLAAYFEVPQ